MSVPSATPGEPSHCCCILHKACSGATERSAQLKGHWAFRGLHSSWHEEGKLDGEAGSSVNLITSRAFLLLEDPGGFPSLVAGNLSKLEHA